MTKKLEQEGTDTQVLGIFSRWWFRKCLSLGQICGGRTLAWDRTWGVSSTGWPDGSQEDSCGGFRAVVGSTPPLVGGNAGGGFGGGGVMHLEEA